MLSELSSLLCELVGDDGSGGGDDCCVAVVAQDLHAHSLV